MMSQSNPGLLDPSAGRESAFPRSYLQEFTLESVRGGAAKIGLDGPHLVCALAPAKQGTPQMRSLAEMIHLEKSS